MSGTFSWEEVRRHNTPSDCWIVIDGDVYDVTKFAKFHPGAPQFLYEYAGKDATEAFFDMHRIQVLQKYQRLKVGRLEDAPSTTLLSAVAPGTISAVPYSESSYWMGLKSPYFTESHKKFRAAVRKFYDVEMTPHAAKYENSGKYPPLNLYQKLGANGLLVAKLGPGHWMNTNALSEMGIKMIGGVKPEEFTFFHELICHQEHAQMGYPGFADSLSAGFSIGLPPVLYFGSKAVQKKVVGPVLRGDKRICLAITEPFAGSDVANIRCTAKKTADGKHYIVNGAKKWITNGAFCDYFVTAVRTGGRGMKGISMLLIERSKGVETSQISTSYSKAAGTGYITFDNVLVPVGNLIGKENRGFMVIMKNFNHERWMIIVSVLAGCRQIVSECFKWANQRKVFGKNLLSQPVIRLKLASMVSQLEACENWLENITYQMDNMSYSEMSKKLAGPIALLKYRATRTSMSIADEAAQIFGGRAITKTGMGAIVEGFMRSVKFGAILGGSEEIMADLGIRQAIKFMPKNARL